MAPLVWGLGRGVGGRGRSEKRSAGTCVCETMTHSGHQHLHRLRIRWDMSANRRRFLRAGARYRERASLVTKDAVEEDEDGSQCRCWIGNGLEVEFPGPVPIEGRGSYQGNQAKPSESTGTFLPSVCIASWILWVPRPIWDAPWKSIGARGTQHLGPWNWGRRSHYSTSSFMRFVPIMRGGSWDCWET